MGETALHEVDLVVFEAGGRRWAADAWDVTRIGRVRDDLDVVRLGELSQSGLDDRALVIACGDEETQVPIDRLLGFERVSPRDLRRLPPFARPLASPSVAGAWLAPESIVLLIDLVALVKERRATPTPQPPSKSPPPPGP